MFLFLFQEPLMHCIQLPFSIKYISILWSRDQKPGVSVPRSACRGVAHCWTFFLAHSILYSLWQNVMASTGEVENAPHLRLPQWNSTLPYGEGHFLKIEIWV